MQRLIVRHSVRRIPIPAQLGHSDPRMTLEIYTLPIPAHQREAVENLSRMVTNGDESPKNAEALPLLTQQIQ